MIRSRARPYLYDPSTDAALILWMDSTDSSKILNTVGGAITDGATVGTWSNKTATARNFTQWGTNGRPVYRASGISGLAALEFSSTPGTVLTTATVTGFTSLSGLTVCGAFKKKSGNGSWFAMDITDSNTGLRDVNELLVAPDSFLGVRINTDTFTGVGGDTTVALAEGVTTAAINYSAAKADLLQRGVEKVMQTAFGTSGTTSATEPAHLSIGAQTLQSASAINVPFDGFLGEILVWPSYMTPDTMVPVYDYLCNKWGGGTL